MTSKELRAEIERAREVYNSLFTLYVDAQDRNDQASYKRMRINQGKTLEELVKMYREKLISEGYAESGIATEGYTIPLRKYDD